MWFYATMLIIVGLGILLAQALDGQCRYQANDAMNPGKATRCIMSKGHSGLVHCDKYGGTWSAHN